MVGNVFNVANAHFQDAANKNKRCKRHRRQDNGRRRTRAEVNKEEACTCGHKVRLSERDCEIIAAHAGIARANNSETVREIRYRFRAWRRQLKQHGESDGEDSDAEEPENATAAAAAAAAAVHVAPTGATGGTAPIAPTTPIAPAAVTATTGGGGAPATTAAAAAAAAAAGAAAAEEEEHEVVVWMMDGV